MKTKTDMQAVSNIKNRSLAQTIKGSRLTKIMAFGALMTLPDAASSAVFKLDILYSAGAIAPSTTTPWLTVTVTDSATVQNQVTLTFSAPGLTVGEYVDDWYLNLALEDSQINAINPDAFQLTGRTGSFVAPTIEIGPNAFVAGPDCSYDLHFAFANGGGAAARFGYEYDPLAPDTLTYTVTGPTGFGANSFDTLSAPGSGPYGPYATAAHVGGIPNPTPTDPSQTGSAWIASTTIPEPSAGLLGMLAATACSIFARRRRDSMA